MQKQFLGRLCASLDHWSEESALVHLHDEHESTMAEEFEKLRTEGVADAMLLLRQVINLRLPPNGKA